MKTSPKRKRLLVAGILGLGAAVAAGWYFAGGRSANDHARKVLYYQDSMHPWIKSDRPGKCTVCLMDLTPIYEGDQGFDAAAGVVVLSTNSVTVLNVQTAPVKRQALHRTVRVAGTLEADDTRKTIIGAPAPGRIDDVAIESAGVEVKRGQMLASFYSPDLSFQTRRYIFRDRITAREDMTARENVLGSSRHAPRLNESTSSHPVPMNQQADPFYNDLLSPQAGTVVERNVYDGQYVAEGDRLFTIVDFSVLWFRFDVYEQQLPWLANGQQVEVIVSSVPGRVFSATISIIEPSFLDATRTAKVRADIENALVGPPERQQRLLRLGMYAEGRVHAVVPDVLVVPRTAVLFPGGHAYAYVDKGNGAYEMRRVELGRQGDTHWEILSGLDEGEQVVTSGNVLIDAQAQFTQNTDFTADDEAGMPAAEALSADQQQALTNFLAVANGISVALANDSVAELNPHTARLPEVVPALAAAFGEGHEWHELIERIEASVPWPAATDLAAARQTFLRFSTNVVALVEELRAQQEAFRSLKVFLCPMAPKPGLWFQAQGVLRNPYYGSQMLSCGEEVRPKPLARSLAAKPVGLHSLGPDAAAAPSHPHPMNRPGQMAAAKASAAHAAMSGMESNLTASQRQALELFLTVAAGLSQALAADQLADFNRHLAKLPAVLPVVRQEFAASHPWQAVMERISAASQGPAAKDLDSARQVFLPLSTNLVALVQQLRQDESLFESLKVFVCPMAPKPGLWFQATGPLKNPYFGAKMLTCGEEVPVAAKPGTANRPAPAGAQSTAAGMRLTEPATTRGHHDAGMMATDPVAAAMRNRLAGLKPVVGQPGTTHSVAAATPSVSVPPRPTAGPTAAAAVPTAGADSHRELPVPVGAPAVPAPATAGPVYQLQSTSHYTNAGASLRQRLTTAMTATAPTGMVNSAVKPLAHPAVPAADVNAARSAPADPPAAVASPQPALAASSTAAADALPFAEAEPAATVRGIAHYDQAAAAMRVRFGKPAATTNAPVELPPEAHHEMDSPQHAPSHTSPKVPAMHPAPAPASPPAHSSEAAPASPPATETASVPTPTRRGLAAYDPAADALNTRITELIATTNSAAPVNAAAPASTRRGLAAYDPAADALDTRFAELIATTNSAAPVKAATPASTRRGLTAYDPAANALDLRFGDAAAPTNAVAPKQAATVNSSSPNQLKAMQALLNIAGGISEALAADDVQHFNQETARLTALLRVMKKEYPPPHRWSECVQRLAALETWPPANDLPEARRHFLQFSTNVVALAKDLRHDHAAAFGQLKIYQCPMAPPPGTWIQTNGPLRNPFYGAQMLTCGKEVKE